MSKARDLATFGNVADDIGRRNLIINGAMQVAQRGTSDTVDGGGWDYVIDRFCALGQSSAGVFTYSQDSDAPAGFQQSLKVAVTTADASIASCGSSSTTGIISNSPFAFMVKSSTTFSASSSESLVASTSFPISTFCLPRMI